MEIQPLLHMDLDPGPVDQSVLVWQHEHRSAAIWEDKVPPRELTCRHKLLGMRDWPLDPRVCHYLIEFGLYGVYKVAFIQLDYALITALVERWRPETHTFHLPVGETTITLQDVNVLLGLRVDGPAVTGSTKYNWADLCEDLLGRRPGLKDLHGSHISLGWLRDNFRNLPPDADEESLKRHTRAFVLALMSGFLFGDKSKHDVALTFLPLLRDFDEVAQLSWGSATLALLYRELCRASKRTVSTICGPLVLLQLWAWERLHVGRPGRLRDVGASYMEGIDGPLPDPLGCRWRASLSHKENPRGGLDFYRDQFDQQKDDQVIWQPYTQDLLEKLPPICLSGPNVWRTVAPLICFDVVEWHRPDRVLRQFGFRQQIPAPCDNEKALHAIDKRGKSEYDWSARHSRHIELWEARQSTVVAGEPENGPMDYLDPYMEWYRRITRKIISPLKERRPGQFQPTGFAFQLLIQRVAAIHARCKATLDYALTVDTARLALEEIHDICSGTLQITSPLVSLSNGSPSQAPTPESFPALAQPSASDVNIPLGTLTPHSLDTEITQKPLSTEVVFHPSAKFSAGPLETLPPVQVLEADSSLSSFSQKPLSWPCGGKLTFSWICDIMLSFDWSSRNLNPAEFSNVLPVHVFDDLVLSASKILKKEPNCIKIDSDKAKVVVVGDLHGQLHDLLFLMQDAGFPDDDQFYVFNGNYVDKGAWGLETFLLLLAWKVFLPERVYLLRGNHESESCTSAYGFRNEVLTKYGDKGLHVYKKCLDCFQLLPLASVIAGKVFTAHGGLFRSHLEKQEKNRKRKRNQRKQTDDDIEIEAGVNSVTLGSLEDLSKTKRRVLDPPTEGSNLIPGDILWSDPTKDDGLFPNKETGIGLLWGPDCTRKFLEDNELKLIVRGHEGPDARKKRVGFAPMDEGYAKDHEGLMTLFSAPDYPQFQDTEKRYDNKGAYLILQIPEFEEPEIHSFEAAAPRPKVEAYYDFKSAAVSLGKLECQNNISVNPPTTAAGDKDAADSAERLEDKSNDSEPMEVDDKDAVDSAELLECRNDAALDSRTLATNDNKMTDSSEKLENGTCNVVDSETAAASDKGLVHHVEKVPSKAENATNSEPMETDAKHAADSDKKLESRTDEGIDPEKMVVNDKHVDSGEAMECRTENGINFEAGAVDDKHEDDSAEKFESRSSEANNPESASVSDVKAAGSTENLEQIPNQVIDSAKEKECTTNEVVDSEPTATDRESADDDAEKPESKTNNGTDLAEKMECAMDKSIYSEPTAADSMDTVDSPMKLKCTTKREIDSVGKLEHMTPEAIDSEPKAADGKNEDDSAENLEGKTNKANDTESTAAGDNGAIENLGLASKEAIDSVPTPTNAKDAAESASKSECITQKGSDSESMVSDNKGAVDSHEKSETRTKDVGSSKSHMADDKDKSEAMDHSDDKSCSEPMDTGT